MGCSGLFLPQKCAFGWGKRVFAAYKASMGLPCSILGHPKGHSGIPCGFLVLPWGSPALPGCPDSRKSAPSFVTAPGHPADSCLRKLPGFPRPPWASPGYHQRAIAMLSIGPIMRATPNQSVNMLYKLKPQKIDQVAQSEGRRPMTLPSDKGDPEPKPKLLPSHL